MIKLDDLDRKILGALRLNARKPFLELAKDLGVSDATIHTRVHKLIKDGVIKGFETIINDRYLGFGITGFIEINIEPGTIEKVVEKMSRLDGVMEVHEIHGHYDILLKVRTKDLNEFRDKLVNEIRPIEEVVSTEAYTVLKVVKEEHSLPIITSE